MPSLKEALRDVVRAIEKQKQAAEGAIARRGRPAFVHERDTGEAAPGAAGVGIPRFGTA